MSFKIYAVLGAITLIISALAGYKLMSMSEQIKALKSANAQIQLINSNLAAYNERLGEEFAAGIAVATELKQNTIKEVKIIERIKEVNANTCLDAINAIYRRLCEQSGAENCPSSDTKATELNATNNK